MGVSTVSFTEADQREYAERETENLRVQLLVTEDMGSSGGVRQQDPPVGRAFLRENRRYGLRRTMEKQEAPALPRGPEGWGLLQSNRLCQEELQEHSVPGASQALTMARRVGEGCDRLRMWKDYRWESWGWSPEDIMEMFGRKQRRRVGNWVRSGDEQSRRGVQAQGMMDVRRVCSSHCPRKIRTKYCHSTV